MKKIKVQNFGPIAEADVDFGDLTIFVGSQASGKSLFLELLKLMVDKNAIINNLKRYNYIIGKKDTTNLLDIYLGNGLSSAWKPDTTVEYNNEPPISEINTNVSSSKRNEEQMFYIPAQRILSISDGRPKAFSEFDPSTPYVLRQFSEMLRIFMAGGLGGNNTLFPIKTRLKNMQRNSFNSSIFHDGRVEMVNQSGQRKMVLKVDDIDMPFMTWSAGQKEFMPLLMGFYIVTGPPTQVFNKDQFKYVVIEEPEMGLHPQAIKAILLQILEIIQSGRKVIISTHSSVPLEFVWAFNILKESKMKGRELALLKLFDQTANKPHMNYLNGIFDKRIKTYFFSRKEGKVHSLDISSLNAFDDNDEISGWGGLSDFASETAELVSRFCGE